MFNKVDTMCSTFISGLFILVIVGADQIVVRDHDTSDKSKRILLNSAEDVATEIVNLKATIEALKSSVQTLSDANQALESRVQTVESKPGKSYVFTIYFFTYDIVYIISRNMMNRNIL